jgi:hypothetical protein
MTAVEFLIDRLEVNKIIPNPYPGEYWNILKRRALEMEKEQIVYAWNSAYGGDAHHSGEDFYTETFKSE